MKKFYKIAEAGTAPGGYVVRLDGKPLRTPLKNLVLLDSKPLAEAVAEEWMRQGGGEVQPLSMPLTLLANTMMDKTKGEGRQEVSDRLLEYGGSDLVCYFATHPAELVRRHEAQWRPLILWMKERYGIVFDEVSGIQYHHQPQESMDRLEKLLQGLSPADFTVVQAASATAGSLVIALALLEGRLSADEAYQASCVDEIYQLDTWGDDPEARQRLEAVRSELRDIARFRDLVRTSS